MNLEEQIHVILDTNALWKDFDLKSADFGELITFQEKGVLCVYVPEVVVQELSRQQEREHRSALKANITKLAGVQSELRRLQMPGAPNCDIKALRKQVDEVAPPVKKLSADLTDRLQAKEVKILPLPIADSRNIFEDYIARRKPFKEDKGEGLADYLLWRTVVDHAENAETKARTRIIFITNNSKDFGKEKKLYDELEGDLSGRCEVELWSEIKSFLSEHRSQFEAVLPKPEPTDLMSDYNIIREAIRGYAESELVYEEVCGSDLDYEMQSGLLIEGYDLPSEAQNPYIQHAEVDNDSVIWDSYYNEHGTELGRVEASMDVILEGYVFKSELPYLIEDGKAAVVDGDWNDHMAVAQWERRVIMTLHIRLESEQVEVLNLESLEIDSRS
ncbi:PIN domain-containing protein [Glutamicibacter sp. NPDC090743]|uniref:PIN domain-containing protein n=1 Tax=Glutamicibacter sp. NPDC090743 TaxID=3364001 RepID=UPI003804CF37